MKSPRPDLPKKLAARIRAAQAKVERDRLSVMGTEHNIAGDRAWIGEFEADPEAFARKHYHSHSVDGYPVTTTIARSSERLEYNIRRQPVRIERLAETGRTLAAVEEEVLREVEAMQPTKGRVPWPAPLPTMKRFREMAAEADRRWEEQDRREREAWAVKQEAQDARDQLERDRQNEIEIAEHHRQFALLPAEQARQREASAKIIAAVESGEISKRDLFDAVLKASREGKI